MSASPVLFVLLKVFDKLEYAEVFRAGKLYMQTPHHFREYRDASGQLRGDPFEGLAGVIPASAIGEIRVGSHTVKGSQLVEPLRVYPTHLQHANIFCTYAISTAGLGPALTPHNARDTKRAFSLQQQCLGLGNHVVVIKPEPFIQRMIDASRRQDLPLHLRLVEYYDEKKLDAFFREDDVLFRKRECFSFLREYRAVIYRDTAKPQVLEFDIGDLSDITSITTPNDFNDSISFKLEDGRTLDQFIKDTTVQREPA